jgi:hypothetical protein
MFNAQQIKSLKKEFSVINSVNPDRLPEFHAMFDKMDDETLAQVVKADIKWLSSLGRNAAIRRKIKLS